MTSPIVTIVEKFRDDDHAATEPKSLGQSGVRGRSISVVQALDPRRRISSFVKRLRLSKPTIIEDTNHATLEGDDVAVMDDQHGYLDLVRQQSAAWIAGPDNNKSRGNQLCSNQNEQSLISLCMPEHIALHAGPQTLATWKRYERERLELSDRSSKNSRSDDTRRFRATSLNPFYDACCDPRSNTRHSQEKLRFVYNTAQSMDPEDSARRAAAFRQRMSVDEWAGFPAPTSWHYGAVVVDSLERTNGIENSLSQSRRRAYESENYGGADHHEYVGGSHSITVVSHIPADNIAPKPRRSSLAMLIQKLSGNGSKIGRTSMPKL